MDQRLRERELKHLVQSDGKIRVLEKKYDLTVGYHPGCGRFQKFFRIGKGCQILFMDHVTDYKYGYYFTWMGRPIIQHPQDMVALQEIIMEVQPDLIIETGIAHGGSLINDFLLYLFIYRKFVMHQQKFLDSCVGIIPFSPGTDVPKDHYAGGVFYR